jgi:hypothetical protein
MYGIPDLSNAGQNEELEIGVIPHLELLFLSK